MADSCSVTRSRRIIPHGSISTRVTTWVSLPPEIRHMILNAIVHQKSAGWASFASISKEWQLFIEERNFCRLKLQASCLDQFKHIIIRQRGLVRHIQLDIELRRYTCRCCECQESESWTSSNNSLIRSAIWKLFSILSTWESTNTLTLELHAHSPSDSEHWFKNFFFASDTEGDDRAITSLQEVNKINPRWHDPKHGWINGQQVETPSVTAILRLFETISLSFPEELPPVDIITKLIICRQLRRRLQPRALQLILNKLCRLEYMVYEPWRVWDSWDREIADQGTY
jgi:hypothetical protein